MIDETDPMGRAVSPQAAERVDDAVGSLLAGRPPRAYPAGPDELEALRGAALLAGTRDDVAEATPEFVDALAARLRTALEPGAEVVRLPRPARRSFLIGAGAAAAAAAAGVVADRLIRGDGSNQYNAAQGGTAELQPNGATWQDVAALESVKTKGPLRFRAGAVEGVLVLTADGGVKAYSAVCTHMGCVLDVARTPDRLVCPCHNASFNVDGTPDASNYIALPRLPWLHSRVNGDRVEVLA